MGRRGLRRETVAVRAGARSDGQLARAGDERRHHGDDEQRRNARGDRRGLGGEREHEEQHGRDGDESFLQDAHGSTLQQRSGVVDTLAG